MNAGHFPHHLPKFAPSTIVRAVKHGFSAYHDVSDAYSKNEDSLQKAVDKHTDTFIAVRSSSFWPDEGSKYKAGYFIAS